jgi:hypothetical protein
MTIATDTIAMYTERRSQERNASSELDRSFSILLSSCELYFVH